VCAAIDLGAQARELHRADRQRADDADFGDADRGGGREHVGQVAHLAAQRDIDARADILLVRRGAERGDVGGGHLPLAIGARVEIERDLLDLAAHQCLVARHQIDEQLRLGIGEPEALFARCRHRDADQRAAVGLVTDGGKRMVRPLDQLDEFRFGGDQRAGGNHRVDRGVGREQRLDRREAVVAAAGEVEADHPRGRKQRHRRRLGGEQRRVLRELRARQVEPLGLLAREADEMVCDRAHRRFVRAGEEDQPHRGVEARLAFEIGGLDALH